jgi:hypothetical protein
MAKKGTYQIYKIEEELPEYPKAHNLDEFINEQIKNLMKGKTLRDIAGELAASIKEDGTQVSFIIMRQDDKIVLGYILTHRGNTIGMPHCWYYNAECVLKSYVAFQKIPLNERIAEIFDLYVALFLRIEEEHGKRLKMIRFFTECTLPGKSPCNLPALDEDETRRNKLYLFHATCVFDDAESSVLSININALYPICVDLGIKTVNILESGTFCPDFFMFLSNWLIDHPKEEGLVLTLTNGRAFKFKHGFYHEGSYYSRLKKLIDITPDPFWKEIANICVTTIETTMVGKIAKTKRVKTKGTEIADTEDIILIKFNLTQLMNKEISHGTYGSRFKAEPGQRGAIIREFTEAVMQKLETLSALKDELTDAGVDIIKFVKSSSGRLLMAS